MRLLPLKVTLIDDKITAMGWKKILLAKLPVFLIFGLILLPAGLFAQQKQDLAELAAEYTSVRKYALAIGK